MNIEWTKLNEEPMRLGRRRILRRTYRLPDGRVEDYDVKHEPLVVAVVPITAAGRVVLARQFRPGPEAVLLEIPGGGIEPGETPEQAAQRELLEETGYSGELHALGVSVECAYSTMRRYNFAAVNCRRSGPPQPDENEFIEVIEVSLDEFRAHLRGGQLSDVETGYLALDTLGLL